MSDDYPISRRDIVKGMGTLTIGVGVLGAEQIREFLSGGGSQEPSDKDPKPDKEPWDKVPENERVGWDVARGYLDEEREDKLEQWLSEHGTSPENAEYEFYEDYAENTEGEPLFDVRVYAEGEEGEVVKGSFENIGLVYGEEQK